MKDANLKVMALILARGGSTGVKNKNIKPLDGKPLITHTIEKAKASKFINRIVVGTDNPEIKKVAINDGAEVPFDRPEEMSQKLSRAYDAYRFYLDSLKKHENYRPDIVVLLFSTSFTKTTEQIDQCISKLIDTDCDWVFTVTECEHHPYRFFKPTSDDKMKVFVEGVESYNIWGNRQELPLVYRINGNAFVTWTENIEQYTTYNIDNVKYSDSDVRYVLCSQEDSLDIDTPFDFEIAEFIMKSKKPTRDQECIS